MEEWRKQILGILRPWKELGPLSLLVLAVTPQEPPQLLVHPLHLTMTPSFSMKALHTRDVNWGPQSETMSFGKAILPVDLLE